MRFKEWCESTYGIKSFSEAKVVNSVFIPALDKKIPCLDLLLMRNAGWLTTHQGSQGLVLSKQAYDSVMPVVATHWGPSEACVKGYFASLGFDIEKRSQYRIPPGIHIQIDELSSSNLFFQKFYLFNTQISFDLLHQHLTILLPAHFIESLYACYYQYAQTIPQPYNYFDYWQTQKIQVECLLQAVLQNFNSIGLNNAQLLSNDYDNTPSLAVRTYNSCSAYAFSLKIYAELYSEALSEKWYHDLCTASALLESYDSHGNLNQGLKTDTLFTEYLFDFYVKSSYLTNPPNFPFFDKLPFEIKNYIFSAINQNSRDLFYGNPKSQLQPGFYCSMLRFLPDSQNNSETDEIIFFAGVNINHFAICRLIKVAKLKNGQLAQEGDIPHHFDYFKVVHNLGEGAKMLNLQTQTCLGVVVTKIKPLQGTFENGLKPLDCDPHYHPEEYQRAMEETLLQLIKVERLISLHRLNCGDEKDWAHLYQLQNQLAGKPHHKLVHYWAFNPHNPQYRFKRSVVEEMDYLQEGGSCAIFSIKSLVKSLIGSELASLHTNFMQTHGANACRQALEQRHSSCQYNLVQSNSFFQQNDSSVSPSESMNVSDLNLT